VRVPIWAPENEKKKMFSPDAASVSGTNSMQWLEKTGCASEERNVKSNETHSHSRCCAYATKKD
jgi:hypothetical protein